MAKLNSSPKRRRHSLTSHLPAAFNVYHCPPDDPEIHAAQDRWCENRNRADLDRLVIHLLPWVRYEAMRLHAKRPDFYRDVEEMISDGAFGLTRLMLGLKRPGIHIRWVRKAIRNEMRRGVLRAMPGGAANFRRDDVLRETRSKLALSLGRVPLRDEILQSLQEKITNPAIEIEPRKVRQMSQLEDPFEQRAVFTVEDDRVESPESKAMSAEAVQLAMKTLSGVDRKIFRLILKGATGAEIAERVGLTRQRIDQRLNGVLWELRNRADLAKYFDLPEKAVKASLESTSRGRIRKIA